MQSEKPTIAAIRANAGVHVDAILAEVAITLRDSNLNVAGILQEDHGGSDLVRPITRLRDISDGTLVQILQDLGREARGCRLDPGALAEAARRVENAIGGGADLLILNRFGKAEAEGAGLRSVIERAMLVGVPVLTAVRGEYAAAWTDFHAGMATWLPADSGPILAWCRVALGLGQTQAGRADKIAPARW